MKRILIVSPHFPPVNAADMHRVRQSLPYLREFGWDPVVLAVEPDYVEGYRDDHLLATIPDDVEIHRARAFDYRWTRRVGLGSLALRSLPFLGRAGSRLLRGGSFDLVYFSTTAFPVMVLGSYWKRRFGVPYVIDMQDPWLSEYYRMRPRKERPAKYWFSSRLDQVLEPVAMRAVDGIMAVTSAYIETLKERYPDAIKLDLCREIPFGVSERDFEIARSLDGLTEGFLPPRAPEEIRGIYTGVCNTAMEPVLHALFRALREGLDEEPALFEKMRLYFIGTNYAPSGRTRSMVLHVAEGYGVEGHVEEHQERVPYLAALRAQIDSDFLLLLGTRDPDYLASKLYPYTLSRRPILAVLHESSPGVHRLREAGSGMVATFTDPDDTDLATSIRRTWVELLKTGDALRTNEEVIHRNSARYLAMEQAKLFEAVVASRLARAK